MVILSERSVSSPQQCPQTSRNQRNKRRPWNTTDIEKLLPILDVVEHHLEQLLQCPHGFAAIDPVFRAMSGLYRYAAQKGMSDFCNLAYEVAQAFDPARHEDPAITRRVTALALVAIGQMRCLLTPDSEKEKLQPPRDTEQEAANTHDNTDTIQVRRGHTKKIVVDLLTKL